MWSDACKLMAHDLCVCAVLVVTKLIRSVKTTTALAPENDFSHMAEQQAEGIKYFPKIHPVKCRLLFFRYVFPLIHFCQRDNTSCLTFRLSSQEQCSISYFNKYCTAKWHVCTQVSTVWCLSVYQREAQLDGWHNNVMALSVLTTMRFWFPSDLDFCQKKVPKG